ncbi:hypothetical protein PCO82_13830 [Pectobacteriaceae bacterium CE90]|nr:hypothetical protein PCO82_13830 [Pectobacteriaceae bacterium CE90]
MLKRTQKLGEATYITMPDGRTGVTYTKRRCDVHYDFPPDIIISSTPPATAKKLINDNQK